MKKHDQDRFREYFDHGQETNKTLVDRLAERQQCQITNQQTGRVDVLIRYQLTNAEEDIKNLEKLAY